MSNHFYLLFRYTKILKGPRKIIVKTLVTKRNTIDTFNFFYDVKNWETGGAIKSVRMEGQGIWSVETPQGRAKIISRPNKEFGILDHEFVVGDLSWTVFVRVISNGSGSSVTWTFICPENMQEDQFEEQLKNFDLEINSWKKALES